MRRHLSVALALLLGVVVGSCEFPTAPDGAYRIYPVKGASMYWDQYEIVRKCVGDLFNHTRFEDIEWYPVRAKGDTIQNRYGEWVWAFARGNKIYMASTHTGTGWIMGHEITHIITGVGKSHNDPPFRKCHLMPNQNLIGGSSQVLLDED